MNVGPPTNPVAVADRTTEVRHEEKLTSKTKADPTGRSKERSKKKTWTLDEDGMLSLLLDAEELEGGAVQKNRKWATIAERMEGRTGKQCRERWNNQLRPDLKKGRWSMEEDATIFVLQRELGNQWSKISDSLPGRTDNDIKNRWHSVMRTANNGRAKKKHEANKKRPRAQLKKAPESVPSKARRKTFVMSPLVVDTKEYGMNPIDKSLQHHPAVSESLFQDSELLQVEEMAIAGSLFNMSGEPMTMDRQSPTATMDNPNPPTEGAFEDHLGLSVDTFTPGVLQDRHPFMDTGVSKFVDAPANWHDGVLLAASSLFSMTPRAEVASVAASSTENAGNPQAFWAV